MLEFPLLGTPESPAAAEKAGALMEAATPITFFLLSQLPAGPDRDAAFAGLSQAMLYAHQAICRAGLKPKLAIASQVPDGTPGRPL